MTEAFGKLFIVRGHPGSGKTTFAIKLARRLKKINETRVVESDQFCQPPGCPYIYRRADNKYSHQWCRLEALRQLRQGRNVVVSNTFVTCESIDDLIEICGNPVRVYRMTENYASIHGVPVEKIQEMKDNMEPYPGEVIVTTEKRGENA